VRRLQSRVAVVCPQCPRWRCLPCRAGSGGGSMPPVACMCLPAKWNWLRPMANADVLWRWQAGGGASRWLAAQFRRHPWHAPNRGYSRAAQPSGDALIFRICTISVATVASVALCAVRGNFQPVSFAGAGSYGTLSADAQGRVAVVARRTVFFRWRTCRYLARFACCALQCGAGMPPLLHACAEQIERRKPDTSAAWPLQRALRRAVCPACLR
jgi:hypothetical protein